MPDARRPLAAALTALLLLPLPALAADCLGIGPVGTPARLHEVDAGNAPVFFLRNTSERAGCPADTPACRTDEQLRTGHRVVVGETSGPWSCALHAETRAQRIAGWLPTAALVPVPEPASLRPSDWAARWRGDSERTIRITTARDGAFLMRAEDRNVPNAAAARGAAPPGTVTARITPEGAAARFILAADGSTRPDAPGETEACRMAVQLQGTYLVVQDNARCGGTSFTGLYRRGR